MKAIMRRLISLNMNLRWILISSFLLPFVIIFGSLWVLTQLEILLNTSLIILVPLPFIIAVLYLGIPYAAIRTHWNFIFFLSNNKKLDTGHIEPIVDDFFSKFGNPGFQVYAIKGYYRLKFLWL